jgi:hypothetical protein
MKDTPVRLIPLLCVKCQYPLPAQPEEVAWTCDQCGQGLILDDTRGLRPLDVFFSRAVGQGKKGRPFWVSPGQVTITQRQTYKGNESRAAEQFWAAQRLFYVPAWEAPLEEIVNTGIYLLRNPERMEPGSPSPFLPAVILPGDMQALCEFMITSIEADRRDALKRVDFTLQLQNPQLWILP